MLEVNKIALNRDDDKRISKRDGISTLACRHKSLSWSPILGDITYLIPTIKCLTERIETINPYLIREICIILGVKQLNIERKGKRN